jgi:hypothetical protein
MCTEPKLTSYWHYRADTLSLPLLPACVFVIRDTVRQPRLFAWKFVREPNCSWTEVPLYWSNSTEFDSLFRGSSVLKLLNIVMYLPFSVFCVLFVCKCVMFYCHWFRLLCFSRHNTGHVTNYTLYDIPPIRSVFQVTHTDPRSSLMMEDYCRNM